ncbi:MAG: outer membrane protein assembly factor BamD, partial [candidate division WOR-3 bacterium]
MIKFLMFPILLFSTFCFVFYKEEIEVKEEIKTGYLKEGIEKLNNKKYEEALSIFNKAKEENKELSSFYIFYTNYLLKRYEEAIKEGNKFLTHFPSSSLVDKVFYLLGISYENENFYIRAAQNFLNAYKKTDDIRIKKDSE